ncbi:hypothetical protein IKF33_02350 [Candidatus Saccharibacteria bacterium]|nr:hypothetical protein [Candidatus Saccharibacteria bacterium]
MIDGNIKNANLNKDTADTELENDWESLLDNEAESTAAFTNHALQKAKARERIKQERKHSEPETPYKQQRNHEKSPGWSPELLSLNVLRPRWLDYKIIIIKHLVQVETGFFGLTFDYIF